MSNPNKTVETTRTYYNSDDADRFYATIWGGEDIHIGLYATPDESIIQASRRTVERMADKLTGITPETQILDLGAGYGGSARYLVERFGCSVVCLNLSEVQNERNRRLNQEQGLADRITVLDGSFEEIPCKEDSFDVVWTQDAILHSGDRPKVLEEVDRVLRPGGDFIITDPMQKDGVNPEEIRPVLDRIHLETMGSIPFYRSALQEMDYEEVGVEVLTEQLVNHYSRVRAEIIAQEETLRKVCSQEYLDRMKTGLAHWVNAGKAGNLEWGILHFRKSS